VSAICNIVIAVDHTPFALVFSDLHLVEIEAETIRVNPFPVSFDVTGDVRVGIQLPLNRVESTSHARRLWWLATRLSCITFRFHDVAVVVID
jgi:hypothetical protein